MLFILAVMMQAGLYTVDVPAKAQRVTVELVKPLVPDAGASMWPALATDIITQVRFQADGKWTDWQPRNLLRGRDMADSDADGIPDWVSVMRLRESGAAGASIPIRRDNLMFADTSISAWMPPEGDYWHGKTADRGRFTDEIEHPPGGKQSLRLNRGTSDGQDTAAMRLDLAPPDTDLTVCGWTKYDLGSETSMGVMARFHEFDAEGNRVNKYVILGDDDFHQPSGRSEWVWRALSFHSRPDTTFLNLYPIRMIAAKGSAWASNYEVRLGSVYGSGKVIYRLPEKVTLTPKPFDIATWIQPKPVKVKPGQLYAFRITMRNDIPAHYEPTHQAWVSAYLEFYDKDMRFLDYCKVMAFRPEYPAGAAMHAPKESAYARFMLTASHITYGDKAGMDGMMTASFDDLQLEESDFDPAFTPRPDGPISVDVSRGANTVEVRSFLLSREKGLKPTFEEYQIDWK